MKKKQEESEGLILAGAKKDQQTTDQIDTQVAQDHTDQGQGQDNPDSQEPTATSDSTQEQVFFLWNEFDTFHTERRRRDT